MFKQDETEYRQTDWDSSYATLQRIDSIIKHLHTIRILGVPGRNNNLSYLDTIDRLYMEAQTKMSKEEINKSQEFQTKISELFENFGKIIYNQASIYYIMAWREIKQVVRLYEIFLMKTLDRHNMLMRDKVDPMKKYREMVQGGG